MSFDQNSTFSDDLGGKEVMVSRLHSSWHEAVFFFFCSRLSVDDEESRNRGFVRYTQISLEMSGAYLLTWASIRNTYQAWMVSLTSTQVSGPVSFQLSGLFPSLPPFLSFPFPSFLFSMSVIDTQISLQTPSSVYVVLLSFQCETRLSLEEDK